MCQALIITEEIIGQVQFIGTDVKTPLSQFPVFQTVLMPNLHVRVHLLTIYSGKKAV